MNDGTITDEHFKLLEEQQAARINLDKKNLAVLEYELSLKTKEELADYVYSLKYLSSSPRGVS